MLQPAFSRLDVFAFGVHIGYPIIDYRNCLFIYVEYVRMAYACVLTALVHSHATQLVLEVFQVKNK